MGGKERCRVSSFPGESVQSKSNFTALEKSKRRWEMLRPSGGKKFTHYRYSFCWQQKENVIMSNVPTSTVSWMLFSEKLKLKWHELLSVIHLRPFEWTLKSAPSHSRLMKTVTWSCTCQIVNINPAENIQEKVRNLCLSVCVCVSFAYLETCSSDLPQTWLIFCWGSKDVHCQIWCNLDTFHINKLWINNL